jgi:hypothetical protein
MMHIKIAAAFNFFNLITSLADFELLKWSEPTSPLAQRRRQHQSAIGITPLNKNEM